MSGSEPVESLVNKGLIRAECLSMKNSIENKIQYNINLPIIKEII